jgi:hypothetical protein
VPPGARLLYVKLRPIEKKFERGAADETIETAIVGVDPIQGTVGPNSGAGFHAQRIIVVEFALHCLRGYRGLPYAAGMLRRCRPDLIRPSCSGRPEKGDENRPYPWPYLHAPIIPNFRLLHFWHGFQVVRQPRKISGEIHGMSREQRLAAETS